MAGMIALIINMESPVLLIRMNLQMIRTVPVRLYYLENFLSTSSLF